MSVDFIRHLIEHATYLPIKARPLYLGQMTTAQRNLLPPINGIQIYNLTTNQFEFYEAGAWRTFTLPMGPHALDPAVGWHTGTMPHAILAGIGANDHHAQIHSPTHAVGAGDPLAVGVPSAIAAANAAGVLTDFVRRDHIHAHPDLSGLVTPAHAHGDLSGVTFAQHHDHYARMLWDIFASGGPGWSALTFGSAGRYFLVPFNVEYTITIDTIGFATRETAGGNVIVGAYEDNGDTPVGGSLIVQSASTALAGRINQKIEVPIASTQLTPRLIWLVLRGSASADVVNGTGAFVRAGGTLQEYYIDGAYAALPDPCPAATGQLNAPAMFVMVTSVP